MSIVASIALTLNAAVLIGAVCWKGLSAMRRNVGSAFVVIAAAFLHSMATKPSAPSIEWDDYLQDSGSYFTTNGVTKTGVQFCWRKTRVDLPNAQPLYISKAATNSSEYVLAATTTVGALTHTLTLANPDAYRYEVWHEWMPPSPVHTNSVWIGSVLEKAKGDTGLNKIIIINGELRHNGKVIAPCEK